MLFLEDKIKAKLIEHKINAKIGVSVNDFKVWLIREVNRSIDDERYTPQTARVDTVNVSLFYLINDYKLGVNQAQMLHRMIKPWLLEIDEVLTCSVVSFQDWNRVANGGFLFTINLEIKELVDLTQPLEEVDLGSFEHKLDDFPIKEK